LEATSVRAHLLKLWLDTQASYWFWPSLMATSAIFLAIFTTVVDANIDSDWPESIPFVFSNQPEGARALLATVAGSMITVTGITFSLTLLAVSHATSQFGPRLLTNFMKDRGNQLTLGVFVATFLYCLMVLRTVRSAEEVASGDAPANEAMGAFVPHVSILTAMLLTILSVGVLIYFIHHIPESIRLSNVVADVGSQLIGQIEKLFPETIADAQPDDDQKTIDQQLPQGDFAAIRCSSDGYIQAVDEKGIIEAAADKNLVLEIVCRPGSFASQGMTLMKAWPAKAIDKQMEEQLAFMFARGVHRTSNQNALFLVDQLVEVAARALSPGVNDPMTAFTCFDWLQSSLIHLGGRTLPSKYRFDEQGKLRVIAEPISFAGFCTAIFDQMRPYVAADRNAALRMMEMIHNVRTSIKNQSVDSLLRDHAEQLYKSCQSAGLDDCDLAILAELKGAGGEGEPIHVSANQLGSVADQ